MNVFSVLGFALVFLNPLAAQVEIEVQRYRLAREEVELPIGKKFSELSKMSGKDAKLKIQLGEMELKGTMSNLDSSERIYEFVDQETIRISILKNEAKSLVAMGEDQGEPETKIKAMDGKVILLEKKDGKWVGRVEKGEVEQADKEEIEKEVKNLEDDFNENEDAELYGVKPRAVGDRWDVDPKLLPGMGDNKVTGGKVSLSFIEVKQFQGDLCAVIETTFDVKAVSEDEDKKGVSIQMQGSGRIVRSLSHFTDMKFVGKAHFVMEGPVPPPAPANAFMSVVGEMNIDSRMTEILEGE